MNRRAFLGAALASLHAPQSGLAQTERVRRRVGWLDFSSSGANLRLFERSMRDRGWIKDETYSVDYRGSDGSAERLASVTADLVRLPADVIVAPGPPEALAAKNATKTLPIVIAGVDDPVARGLVATLARPGRNITGVALARKERSVRLLSLLHDLAPGRPRIAVLIDSADPDHHAILADLRAAARTTGMLIQSVEVEQYTDVEPAFQAVRRHGSRILVVPSSSMFVPRWIAELALANQLALATVSSSYTSEGGLIACSYDWSAVFERVAMLVDKILKGANPAALPVERAAKFTVTLNARTARALKLNVSPALLAQAAAVIE